ncbi:bifunctional [glutamate--ammonia ligase]-adenylyl-L-tyrosine phosphorylase/[glutamate--ammonia-ligase] adenylyltransferase [Parasphingopyxis algicola]|uniref:bifunctional [glutamate--ammonia ligase]-adenylyl-L-tyrosine phosphorylase/[glutamate--ammonia-ligase] adenylyltransferase n=1 Tax=Parasphingopyxis algicola TaxID=2026624 RepID=UPI0015A32392|nr:bifunctional [glutamate--ammonia ligase]-adenylyl-L-tyrosine phosphorylase/[glutamate--ammonia-ligase] adenylyltransferase [Parasphingopyxis algicola]QLC26316.1 bifunctional [glutamate--ammonia ligase]-adenylyl-L-tyrosine phosphorylase/[glutamate--ammonia-ligase] adenylyltransferase [Parasphingopyxis algicola]
MTESVEKDRIAAALDRARRYAPFLNRLVAANPEFAESLTDGRLFAHFGDFAVHLETERADSVCALRLDRQKLALFTAIGDLAGAFDLVETTALLSDFADYALDEAIGAAFAERLPDAAPAGFAVIALGKHGSRELNYSSDIDLLFLFDPDTMPRREKDDPQRAAVRIGRRVVEILNERTGDGYVFRVDLRLRPSPEVTPIVLTLGAAIAHYETSAEPWERAVFIRARAAAGDVELGRRFLDAIQPFIWRRSLDFGAIRAIRAMSHRIRDHYAQGQEFGPGYDLKRGRGGIREIEFYAQIHQLIHGGREPELRAPATLDALSALGESGQIAPRDADHLASAYRLFRTIEHRLQMIEDQQTHSLPEDLAALDAVAGLHGMADGAAVLEALSGPVAYVGALYDQLEDERQEGLPTDPERLEQALETAGFRPAADARRRIEGWRAGRLRSTHSAVAREALEDVLPALVSEMGMAPDSIGVINRFDVLLDRLPSAVNLFRLLEARPGLARLLVAVLSHAPALADELARHAELFDGLIDATALDPPEPLGELTALLADRSASPDYQLRLDRMRQLVGEERFALGVQLIEGRSDPLDVASGYARVAEAALTVLADAAITEFEAVHGRIPGCDLVILALGRLGGRALTHASDLDLVYLFTGDHSAQSDGDRSLGATAYFQRLAQRVTAALSVPTAAGPLYEVDTRLRPSGAQGLLAVSFDSFKAYHRDNAWTWEHMALARARPVFGPQKARDEIAATIAGILDRERDPDPLIADARTMRAEIAAHKPPAGPFDVKLVDGGLVDLEFCVHLVQLRDRTGFNPELRDAIAALVEAGLVDPGLADAHDLLTRMLVTLRLVSPASQDIAEANRALVAEQCGADDWDSLVADYDRARQCVSGEWHRLAMIQKEGD